ncbi:MAG: hypothetical protein IKD89_08075 [Clostridia bacterium]|nr:hypothetical protein [Clostridia bacterium]
MHELLTLDDIEPRAEKTGRDPARPRAELFSGLGTEEMLLIGIILLLLFEDADAELIIVLAFLLFSGT